MDLAVFEICEWKELEGMNFPVEYDEVPVGIWYS
jgi:hypothetical protein